MKVKEKILAWCFDLNEEEMGRAKRYGKYYNKKAQIKKEKTK
jgi:hypothetical protein